MIGLITSVLLFCFNCINVSKAGMLCSERQMNWEESINSCSNMAGRLVIIDEKNHNFITQQLNDSIEVWASGRTFFDKCDNGFDVCGYTFIEGFPLSLNENRYGDCNVNRNYICRLNGSLGVYQADYYEAMTCKINFLREQAQHLNLPPGYYWRVENFKVCPHQYRYFTSGQLLSTSLCKVFNKIHGFFYLNCGSTRYAFCEFDDNILYLTEGYTECLSDHNPSTDVPSSSTVTEKVTTSQPTSTIKLPPSDVTTTRESYVSTHKTTQYNHISDLKTPSIYSTLSYKTSTPGTSDLGLKIGLPVALCVVLFGVHVVTLIVYFRRRHRNNGRDENRGEFEDDTVGAISTTNQLQTRNETTVTYEAYNNAANDDSVEHVYSSIDEGGNYEII